VQRTVATSEKIAKIDKQIVSVYSTTFVAFGILVIIGVLMLSDSRLPKAYGITEIVLGLAGLIGFGLDHRRDMRPK